MEDSVIYNNKTFNLVEKEEFEKLSSNSTYQTSDIPNFLLCWTNGNIVSAFNPVEQKFYKPTT